jgi:hypothetical protein
MSVAVRVSSSSGGRGRGRDGEVEYLLTELSIEEVEGEIEILPRMVL